MGPSLGKELGNLGLGFREFRVWGLGVVSILTLSADLGGRVGWLPKAERVFKTLFLSPFQSAGGGRGYPGFVSLQVPTSEAAVSADTHAFARLPPGGLRKIEFEICGKRFRPLMFLTSNPCVFRSSSISAAGPGPKPPGDLA